MEDIYIDLRLQHVWIQREFPNQDMASIEELLDKISDLRDELDEMKEKYEKLKQDVEANYERVSVAEQLGISDSDFI